MSAALRLVPTKSQVFVLALTALGAASLLVSFALLAKGLQTWGVPFVSGWVCIAAAFYAWRRSHTDVDRHGAPPMMIKDSLTGVEASTDSRTLDNPAVRQLFSQLVSVMAHRAPLPPPDGLVGPDKRPIPGTQAEAIRRVEAVNVLAASLDKEAIASLRAPRETTELTQIRQADLPTSIDLRNLPPQSIEN
jgi:hypothetical protein